MVLIDVLDKNKELYPHVNFLYEIPIINFYISKLDYLKLLLIIIVSRLFHFQKLNYFNFYKV